jgi:hypothetical protein
MSRVVRILCILAVLFLAIPPSVAGAASPPPPAPPLNCKSIDKGTEIRVVCLPPFFWNRDLVVFAHGYEFDNPLDKTPLLGTEQWKIQIGTNKTILLPELVNLLGFGFAATSYSKNGLAVQEGVAEMKSLVEDVRAMAVLMGKPVRNVYIVGASEGGLVTTLSMELNADTYKAGLALCGPIGNFQDQINYWGDFRAAFDAIFPGIMPLVPPYDAVNIPDALMADWASSPSATQAAIIAQLGNPANAAKVGGLLALTKAPVDPADPTTVAATTLGILTYNVFATNEARDELSKGVVTPPVRIQPYDNTANLALLAAGAQTYAALPDAATVALALKPYQTTGMLTKPLVTMHTLGDPIVPFWHEGLYASKVVGAGAGSKLTVLPINRYGHCSFKPAEILFSFAMMLYQSNRMPIRMADYNLVMNATDPGAVAEFEALNAQFGDLTQTKLFLPAVNGQ